MNKALRTILRVSLLALVAVIIGVNIYTLNASRLAGNAVPMPFGFGVSVVLSGSMESELSIGDLIFISERDGYEVGDVVVYQDGGIAVVHRIISIDGETVTTKGDANNTPDAAISMESIKGEVTGSLPFVGYLVNAIKSPVGTVIIIALAVWLLERSFHKEKEKDSEQLEKIRAEIESLKKGQ